MYLRSDDRPKGSRLSLRIAVLGGFAVALFAVLGFRLWTLQVLDGDEYLAEAKNNRTREFRILAPRGQILDREGNVLVDNRASLALQLNTEKLAGDPAQEKAELKRIAELIGMPMRRVRQTIRKEEEVAAGAPVTLRRDVSYPLVYYLEENQREFPGLSVERVFVRSYPEDSAAAHILGTVGEVSGDELKEKRYRGLEPGDTVGKGGVEYTYDHYLRGKPGEMRIQVDAGGRPTPGGQLTSRAPTPGENLKLTIDPDVQAAGEAGIPAYGNGRGAFVTMDVHSGEILGMASFPNYSPAGFSKGFTQAEYDNFYGDDELAPLSNRATESHYPTGSIWKIIPALAALESGNLTIAETMFDDGEIVVGGQPFQNAGGVPLGPVSLVPALQYSSDVFFYTLGLRMWDTNILQNWSRKLGIGHPTGIDLPGETEGLVPSKEWRDQLFAEKNTDRPWSAGDNIQLAIGQGDLQTSPLQMAVAYAALGNGGRIVTPRLGLEIEDAAGRVMHEFEPKPHGKVEMNPLYRDAILEGLHDAAQVNGGTSYGIFGGFPVPIAGKTGTAERGIGHGDQSWYAALAPYPNPRIVTIVTIEEGGFGADAAAPVALDILEAYFDKKASEISGENGGIPG